MTDFRIEEQHVFRFVFPFLGDTATFNVVANSQKEAADKIMEWMNITMIELSVAFPKEISVDTSKPKSFEETRIGELLTAIKKYITVPSELPLAVKQLTDLELEPNNYPLIIDKLETLKAAYETGKIKKGK